MSITDEQLSAFLDGELPEHEMATIRNQVAENEQIADRLAALSMGDKQFQSAIKHIDDTPIPQNIMQLAKELDTRSTVVPFPLWKRAHQQLQHYAVAAATVTAVVGFIFGLGYSEDKPTSQAMPEWAAISTALEYQEGGKTLDIGKNITLTNNLTFLNKQEQYCRQFSIHSDSSHHSQNIACREKNGNWMLHASMPVKSNVSANEYQTASHSTEIDAVLDGMIKGQVLNPGEEKATIMGRWIKPQDKNQ